MSFVMGVLKSKPNGPEPMKPLQSARSLALARLSVEYQTKWSAIANRLTMVNHCMYSWLFVYSTLGFAKI